jgi:hypothetical protein
VYKKPTEDLTVWRAGTKDSVRNGIVLIENILYHDAIDKVTTTLSAAMLKPHVETNRYGHLELPYWYITAEDEQISMFMEEAETYEEHLNKDKITRKNEPKNYLIWISFTVKKKNLTKWRKKLTNIFFADAGSSSTK